MKPIRFEEIKDRPFMTVEEASVYTHLGQESLRGLMSDPSCDFTICVGKKKIIKRDLLVKFLNASDVIF